GRGDREQSHGAGTPSEGVTEKTSRWHFDAIFRCNLKVGFEKMIEQRINFNLPKPWDNQVFSIDRIGELSFLVGPNGSGKSRFANSLKDALPNARLLGTDRLDGMAGRMMASHFGDQLAAGFQKNFF